MPDTTITITLTPRAAAFLDTLCVAHEARIEDERRAHEEHKKELIQAMAESRQPNHHLGHPGHEGKTSPMTREEIATKAFERGLAVYLHAITQLPYQLGGGAMVAHQTGLY